MAVFASTETRYARDAAAWSSNTNPVTFGNRWVYKMKMPTMSAVGIASVLYLNVYRESTGVLLNGTMYTSASDTLLAQDIPSQALYVKSFTFSSGSGWKTLDLMGHESKFNIYTGNFFIFLVPDAGITSIYSFTGNAVNRPNINATYVTGATRVFNGTSWVSGSPHVWNGSAWVPGVAYIFNGTSWVLGS